MRLTTRKRHKQTPVLRVNTAGRLEGLKIILEACFAAYHARQQDDKEISNRTGLCLQTIKRLQSDKLTTMIRYDTLDRIVQCAGLYLVQQDNGGVLVRLVD